MTQDVEKRWSDPRAFRKAALFDGAVIAVAAVVAAIVFGVGSASGSCGADEGPLCSDAARIAFVFAPAAVLLAGGLGAFGITYKVWRRGGVWPVWQGAGWFLLVLLLVFLGMGVQSL